VGALQHADIVGKTGDSGVEPPDLDFERRNSGVEPGNLGNEVRNRPRTTSFSRGRGTFSALASA